MSCSSMHTLPLNAGYQANVGMTWCTWGYRRRTKRVSALLYSMFVAASCEYLWLYCGGLLRLVVHSRVTMILWHHSYIATCCLSILLLKLGRQPAVRGTCRASDSCSVLMILVWHERYALLFYFCFLFFPFTILPTSVLFVYRSLPIPR